MKPIYIPNYIDDHLELYQELRDSLIWIESELPRKEYFMAFESGLTYAYGNKALAPTYQSQPFHSRVQSLVNRLNQEFGQEYNACFLNRYDTGKDFLGFHSDNSPEMSQNNDICVISTGEETREIWWRKQGEKGDVPLENRLMLGLGSLFIMPGRKDGSPGFQDLYFHRIPKSDKQNCKPRISLTFRKYVKIEGADS